MHCKKISAEFKFGAHSPLGAHPQKCGIRLRRWENQRRLSSYNAFQKCPTAPTHLRVAKNSHQRQKQMSSVSFRSWITKLCWNAVHPAACSKLLDRRWRQATNQPKQKVSLAHVKGLGTFRTHFVILERTAFRR